MTTFEQAWRDARAFGRKLFRLRADRDGRRFSLLLTHWFYLSNRSYVGERTYFVRVGQWRKNFGSRRTAE